MMHHDKLRVVNLQATSYQQTVYVVNMQILKAFSLQEVNKNGYSRSAVKFSGVRSLNSC